MIINCDLIIKNGKVFEKNRFKKNHIVIKDGKIFKLTNNIKSFKSKKIINADKKIVIPGIIDIHFHVRAPSFPQRGTVQSETKAAAKGGITTLFEMPISNPCMSNAKVLNHRKKHFDENTYINFAMIPALGKFNDKNLNGLINSGAIAFKVFTIAPPLDRKSEFEGLCFTEEKNILKALIHAKKSNLTTIFHAEDQNLLDHFEKNQKNFKKNNPAMHNAMRPAVVEASAIEKILRLNSIVKTKIHIAHVTSELSLEVISKFKSKGQSITAETCPHYLFKNERDVIKSGPFGKINPPIRKQKDQKKLWSALKNKTLDIIASDHASFSFKEKIKGKTNFLEAPPGAPSGELMLPLMLKAVSEKKIKLEKVIELMCINPAKRFNIFPNKGLIKRGSDADIVILDMNKKWTVDRNTLVSKGKNCAHLYFGEKIKGSINKTIVNGNVVYDGKKFYKNRNMNNFVSPIKKINMDSENLLTIKNLRTHFSVGESVVKAVDGVSFNLEAGKTFAIVGESGSGKSITALSIMGLLPNNLAQTERGEILFDNKNLIDLEENEMRKIRGNRISMIFQEPMTSLNPVYDLSYQISETIILHQKKSKEQARKIAIEMLDLVGIPEPQKRIDSYPHELSGGMRQRAMIAMALSCNPKILIADEPTTALDVTIQAQIIDLMQELQKKLGMSIIFITHDLGVVSEISDHVMVMYLGNVMEIAETSELFNNPLHSYTKSLIDIAPQISEEKRKIKVLKGEIPSPINPPSGCVFRTRCPCPTDNCEKGISKMGLIEAKPGHWVDKCCYECNKND